MSKIAKFAIGKVVSTAVGGGLGGAFAGAVAGELAGGAMGSKGRERVLLPGGGENGMYTVDYNDGKGPQVVDTSAYRIKGDKGIYDLIPLMKQGKGGADTRIKEALKSDPTALTNYLKAHPDQAKKTPLELSMAGRSGVANTEDKFGANIAPGVGGEISQLAANAADRKKRGLLNPTLQSALADYAVKNKSPVLLGATTTPSNTANDQLRKTVGLKTVLGG